MKACRDCKHLTGMDRCALYHRGIDYVDGKRLLMHVADVRGSRDKCGHEAKLFDKKDFSVGFFERFLKR